MARFISGTVLLSFAVLFLVVSILTAILYPPLDAKPISGGIVTFFFFGVPGFLLSLSGRKAIKTRKQITGEAIKLLQQEGKVDSQKISDTLGIPSDRVTKVLRHLKSKGPLPPDAQIVGH